MYLGLCGNAICPGSGKNIFSWVIGKILIIQETENNMTAIYQRTGHLTRSSESADSFEVCKVTKEGVPGDWLPSKVTNFVFLGLKKGSAGL